MDWDGVRAIDQESVGSRRKIKEANHIQNQKPFLNRDRGCNLYPYMTTFFTLPYVCQLRSICMTHSQRKEKLVSGPGVFIFLPAYCFLYVSVVSWRTSGYTNVDACQRSRENAISSHWILTSWLSYSDYFFCLYDVHCGLINWCV